VQQHAPGDCGANGTKSRRILQKGDHLLQLFPGLGNPRHIVEKDGIGRCARQNHPFPGKFEVITVDLASGQGKDHGQGKQQHHPDQTALEIVASVIGGNGDLHPAPVNPFHQCPDIGDQHLIAVLALRGNLNPVSGQMQRHDRIPIDIPEQLVVGFIGQAAIEVGEHGDKTNADNCETDKKEVSDKAGHHISFMISLKAGEKTKLASIRHPGGRSPVPGTPLTGSGSATIHGHVSC